MREDENQNIQSSHLNDSLDAKDAIGDFERDIQNREHESFIHIMAAV